MQKAWTRARYRLPGLLSGLLLGVAPAQAKNGHELLTEATSPNAADSSFGPHRLAHGWDGFLDGWRALDMVGVFLLATALGAIIAYHPRTRRKASTIEELEQPKTFVMYALVGALIAIIVQAVPAMSLVIFAIGGLMRFRTNVGPAKDTGRVILTAVVGVCCGLKLMLVAVLATAFGWVLLHVLERPTIGELIVNGLDQQAIGTAAEAYRRMLVGAGCHILGERKRLLKGQVAFVFRAPEPFDRERFEQLALATVAPEVRGIVDWDLS